MAKIAIAVSHALAERARNGHPGQTSGRLLAKGEGWAVRDVICTCGPQDRSFEEQHSQVLIAVVVAGTFQYRSAVQGKSHRELMTPGSLLLGTLGQYFECGHEHAAGDRCISFQYAPEYFERIATNAAHAAQSGFRILRIPPLRSLSPVVAHACAALGIVDQPSNGTADSRGAHTWEELAIELAATASKFAADPPGDKSGVPSSAMASVTRLLRNIERNPNSRFTLSSMARESRLSPYHFLRTFRCLTGVTPHQYLLRKRLRDAAARLKSEPDKVLDIALDCGFGDVSNFNHAFLQEFGVSPREYRRSRNRERSQSAGGTN